MTAIPQPTSARAISDRLTAPLREVARRHWYVLAAVGVFKTLIVGLIALLAASLLLGYFQNLWMPVRVLLAAIAWVLVIGSAIRFLRPALGRWSLSRAAMQVERDRPGLQERLSSAIELANETDPTFRGSPGLISHLFRQAEADATAVHPNQVVPTDRVVRWALLFAPVLLAWMMIALIPSTTKTAMAGLYRVLMPWKDALPAMLTQVVVKPGDITLVQGDPFDVTAHVTFDSGNDRNVRHATLIRKFDTGQRLTDDMEKTSPRDYRLQLEDVQQTFSYMVSTDQGDSQVFKAIVHPRPQISNVEVRCDYPAYTGMSPTVVGGRDGAIEAIVGTRVTLTVHTALPVVAEKSQIVIDEGTPDQLALPLKQLEPNKPDYQAQLIVNHSGEYRINLTNEFDLTNKDEQPRSIVAQPDEVPTIVIRSPEPRVTVGADDIVPVKYIANDDFAVAKIEALLQVDDGAVQTVPVKFKTTDKRTATGPPFIISIADVLKPQNASKAQQISYQLKVTDNRDPDPQFSFSTKQILKINRAEYQSFQTKEERKVAENLTKAIQKAINQLNEEQQHVIPARDIDAHQHLEDWSKKQLHEATQEIPRTSRDLAKAAAEAKDSVFQDIARQVEKIATRPIRSAAEDATQADLNADNGEDRKEAANRSVAEINQARDALQKILDKQEIDKTERQAEAARDLADAAKKQEEAAEMMKSPQQVAQQQQQQPTRQAQQQQQEQQRQAMHKQEQANQKLQQALQQSEALRDPRAQETAQKLADLIRKVEDLEKKQDTTAEQTEKQQAATDIQQKANDLAKQQEALNQEVQKSTEQNKDALQKANANPPSKDQQQNIVKELNRNNIQPAHDQMRQVANQLHQEAQQLNNQIRSNELHPNPQQQDALNKDQQAADQAQNQRNAAQQAANDLKQRAAQPDAMPHADDPAVANAKQAARQIEKQAADLHPQNDDARHAAEAAQQDAQAAEKAADEAVNATNPQEARKDLNDAAKDLNQAGQELADASKKNADADKREMVKAQQKDAQAAAEQAEQQAREQEALAQGLEAQEKALAKVQNHQPPEQSAQQQHEIADQARDAQQQADQLQHQAQQAKNPNVEARAEEAKADLAEAQQHAAEAAKAQQKAGMAQQEAASADNADKARAAEQNADRALEQAANDQRQAKDALAKAESELRNLPTQQAMANAQKPTDAQADAARQNPGEPNSQAKASQQQAAQAAQEAAQAQQEASQQNPAAAQQAAKALAQAAQALAQATPGLQPGPDKGEEPGNEPGQEPSPTPGQTPDSKQGISAGSAPISLPASVRDIGITADQWAILPPLVKKDLMNAAQQNGPPAYRQMIKDYYVRVAKIQQAGTGAALQ